MSGKYDHIQLGREFRDVVKARLKALPGWRDYVDGQGWRGRTEALTRAEIIGACEALGLDLVALASEHAAGAIQAAGGAAPQPNPFKPLWPTADGAADPVAALPTLDEIVAAEAKADESDKPENAGSLAAYEGQDPDVVVAETLAAASVHFSAHLASILPGLVRPLAEAAVRGPRVVTQTIVQEAGAPTGAAVVTEADKAELAPKACKVLKTLPLYQAFGMRKSDAGADHAHTWVNLMVDVCDHRDPLNPVDPDYFWQPGLIAELAVQDANKLNGWVYGVAGTGKTDGAAQYAAVLGRPFVRIPIERTTEPSELIGQMVPARGGGMVWQDGKLTRAMRIPRAVILIDEPSFLRSGTLAAIQTALDQRKLYLSSGETVEAAPGVFFMAADNTAGCGDDTGRYRDTEALNAAFMDRFALKTELGFLSPGQEANMLAARTGVHVAVARAMVDYATVTRQNADAGKLTMSVTPRRLLVWARTARGGLTSSKAFQAAIVAGAASEDKAVLEMLESQTIKSRHKWIDGVLRGTIDPNAPEVQPGAHGVVSSIGENFPDERDPL
jgi:MoxR-like ATPase